MTIRPARVTDAAVISAVRAASWRAAYRGIVPDSVLDRIDEARATAFWTETLRSPRGPRHCTLVAARGDEVVGFTSGGPSRDAGDDPASVAEIYTLYLLPATWRTGIGTALLAELVGQLEAVGFREAALWVLEANQRGRAFYAACGFEADGTERTITIGTPLAELRYRMRLPPFVSGRRTSPCQGPPP